MASAKMVSITLASPSRLTMPQTVEINLRIPSLNVPGEKERTINDFVRFVRPLEFASIPKIGEL